MDETKMKWVEQIEWMEWRIGGGLSNEYSIVVGFHNIYIYVWVKNVTITTI